MLTVSLLMCALVALSRADDATAAAPACAENWLPFDKFCYQYVADKMSWADAEKNCQKNNGNLVSVHNLLEQTFINSLVPQDAAGVGMWVGASDCQQDGTWMWSDGSTFQFTYWCPAKPNNLDGNQHCLQADAGDCHCWNDRACSELLPSVCRADL